jgi:hypothetical protein
MNINKMEGKKPLYIGWSDDDLLKAVLLPPQYWMETLFSHPVPKSETAFIVNLFCDGANVIGWLLFAAF